MTLRWYLGGVVAGAAIGWFAAKCHLAGFAPVGLLSLGIGLALGFMVSKLAAPAGIHCSKRLVAGTLIFALIAVFVEHTWLYADFRRQWVEARANDAQVAMFRAAEPWSPAEYFRHETSPGRVMLWCVDATLIAASAVGVVLARRSVTTKELVAADDANSPDTRHPTPDT